MDAPEVVSGPERSLSYMLRRQPKLQIPPPVHSPVERSGSSGTAGGSMYEFYISKTEDEKDAAPARPKSTIWGYRRKRVILCLSLIIVILLATIGGGVGGGIAAANARRGSNPNPMILMMPTTITMMPTATSAEPTSTPAAEDQNTAADTIIRVPTRGVIDFDCGRISMNRQVVTLGTASWGFDVNCMMDYIGPGVDLAGMTAYTFGDCIRACAMFNKFARNNTCLGVFFSANLTTSLPTHNANCFLKSYLPQMSPERDLAAAASLGSSPQFMKRGEGGVEGGAMLRYPIESLETGDFE